MQNQTIVAADTPNYGAFFIRAALGGILLSHGLLKIFVFTLAGTVGYFESLGLPAIAAYLTVAGELGLGISLLLGLFTRVAAIASLPILLGALWVHAGNGWVFSNQGGGWEFPALLLLLALAVIAQGAGSFALGRTPLLAPIARLFPAHWA